MHTAFVPLIGDKIQYGAKVNGLHWNEENSILFITQEPTDAEPCNTPNNIENFDYVFDSVPLNLIKFWDLPKYSSLLKRALDRLFRYQHAHRY